MYIPFKQEPVSLGKVGKSDTGSGSCSPFGLNVVADITYDAQGHVKTPATITLAVYDAKNASTPLTLKDYDDNYGYAKDEYVLVNAYTDKATNSATVSGKVLNTADQYAEIVGKATSIEGAQSVIYWNAQQHNVEGTVYDDAVKFCLDEAEQKDAKYTWYFDSYNNLIGAVEIAAANSYGVINSIWWAGNATDGSGVAKANVTYVDGTTALVDLSKITVDAASQPGQPYDARVGTPTYSVINSDIMTVTGTEKPSGKFYVTTDGDTNYDVEAAESNTNSNNIIAGHLFQFTAQTDGTVAAVEVSGNGTGATATVNGSTVTTTAKKALRSLDVAVGTDALYNGKLLTNSATIFLVRSGNGDTVPFTYKSVTGINAIGNYVQGEVDYVDLNDDGVADYVYIIAASDTAKAEGLFYYAGNNNYSYNRLLDHQRLHGRC